MPMPDSLPSETVQQAWHQLVREIRTGVLLTLRNGHPFGSHVPFAVGPNWTTAYVHLSRLALHTHHLLQDARVSLFVSEPDGQGKQPLALIRTNLQGIASPFAETDPDYPQVKQAYLERFPKSAMTFGFADFQLWQLTFEEAHFVLGFGQAYQAFAADPTNWRHQKPESQRP